MSTSSPIEVVSSSRSLSGKTLSYPSKQHADKLNIRLASKLLRRICYYYYALCGSENDLECPYIGFE